MSDYLAGHLPKSIGNVFAKVSVSDESFRAADAALAKIEFETRTVIVTKALKAAAAPVVELGKKLAPDSIKTGSRKFWSKSERLDRADTAQHKTTIGASSVRTYRNSTIAIYVGPLWPAGNLINVIGHAHAQVLWGRPSGRTIPANTYMLTAGEQTAAEQQAAFSSSIKSQSERIVANK